MGVLLTAQSNINSKQPLKSNFQIGGIIVATNNIFAHQKVCSEIKEIIKKYDLYPIEN